MNASASLKLIVVISDGIRGHVNQSIAVARWLSRGSGADIRELEIPKLEGIARQKIRTAAKRRVAEGNRRSAREWLAAAKGDDLVRSFEELIASFGIVAGEPQSLLVISAGSMASMFNLALGVIWRCTCVCVMTPSIIGTEPFDFAIVPEHDYPQRESNILETLGAPNLVIREEQREIGAGFLKRYPPQHDLKWGVMIGGSDRNSTIDVPWVRRKIGRLMIEADRAGADLYITTSRRTPSYAEEMVERLAAKSDKVRFLLLSSKDAANPVPSMLGACDEIFVTSDSVNMISEAVTAGFRAVLLRADRPGIVMPFLQDVTARLVGAGIVSRRRLWGLPRFEQTIARFKKMGRLIEWSDWLAEQKARADGESRSEDVRQDDASFNEARRAAEWILAHLNEVYHPDRGDGEL